MSPRPLSFATPVAALAAAGVAAFAAFGPVPPASAEEPAVPETVWSDRDPTKQMSDWEDPSNWGGMAPPNAPGAAARIDTPKISKYVVLHQTATVGSLKIRGTTPLAGGILAAEGSGATLRFDNGDAPALFSDQRESRDTVNIPIEFARNLVVSNGIPSKHQPGSPSSVFFDQDASFTPLCKDGAASLAFVIHSRIFPGRDNNIFDRKTQNVVRGFIEDSLDGAPLSLSKDGPGFLAIACCDNAYSGGTTLLDGPLCGINGENLDPPFLPFGTGKSIAVASSSASLSLLSSKPGTWGPRTGYDLSFAGDVHLSIGGSQVWNATAPERDVHLEHVVDSLASGGTNVSIHAANGAKLRVNKPVALARPTVLSVHRDSAAGLAYADVDFAGGIRQSGGTAVSIEKRGTGLLRLGADGDFAGGLTVVSGGVAVASSKALGLGPATFGPATSLILECAAFHPAAKVSLAPGSCEIWRNPLARLGATPDEKAGCRISPGVNLGIGADMRHLRNKTIVLSGGQLFAYRDHVGTDTNAFVLGSGITLYATTTNLDIGNIWYPNDSEFARGDRTKWPLAILGPICEHNVSATLRKHGADRLEIGGVCTYTGGTDIPHGSIVVLPSGRLGSGPITMSAPRWQETWLKFTSPENLAPGTVLHLGPACKLALDFDGEITVKSLFIDGRKQEPGIWGTSRHNGVTHVDYRRLSGKGRLRITE